MSHQSEEVLRTPTKIIQPKETLLSLNIREIWNYRDLLFFLVWRNIKSRYAQTVLGTGWALFKPIISMVVFTLIFGKLAKISSEGVPYAVFNYTALVPWTFFSSSLTGATSSLVGAADMLTKVYFPRIVIPAAAILDKLVDFIIALAILIVMMFFYRVAPTVWAVAIPCLVLMMILASAGFGLWLTALAVQYRDVNYAMTFSVQMFMYACPVVYPTSLIPEGWRLVYALNPMVGVIEGFRASLLGTIPMPWDLIGIGTVSSLVIFISGLMFFNYKERIFADVV
ncbi:MAG: ABC transporter permease [Deltaproteobacteria bacterium]|nr:ABC transporter permease [Candidatus Zymogenaceae bacterium]